MYPKQNIHYISKIMNILNLKSLKLSTLQWVCGKSETSVKFPIEGELEETVTSSPKTALELFKNRNKKEALRSTVENTVNKCYLFMFQFSISATVYLQTHRLVIWEPSCGVRDWKQKLSALGFGWLPKSALLYCTCTVLVVSIQSVHPSVTIHQRNVSHLGPKTLGCKRSSAFTSCLRSLSAIFACNLCSIFILCLFGSQVYM